MSVDWESQRTRVTVVHVVIIVVAVRVDVLSVVGVVRGTQPANLQHVPYNSESIRKILISVSVGIHDSF